MSARLISAVTLRLRAAGVIALTAAAIGAPAGTAATALTLVDVRPNWIYQRVGVSKDIGVAGTYTGTASLIQARLVDATSGAGVTSWVTLDAAPSNGHFAGLLTVPQGDNYKLQVRDGVNNAVTATGSNMFGVGVLNLLFGQSNMVHSWEAISSYFLSSPHTRGFSAANGGSFGRIGNYNDAVAPGTAFGAGGYSSYQTGPVAGGDAVVTYVNRLTASLNVPIGIFEVAVSGTSIDRWVPGGDLYEGMIASLNAAGGDCELAIYYQGENDAGTAASVYQSKLTLVYNGIVNHLAQVGRSALNFAMGLVTLGPTTNYGPEGSFGEIRKGQLAFIAATPGTFLAAVAGDSSAPANDSVHIDLPSEVWLFKRIAKSVVAYLSGAPKPGPHIVGATRAGLNVTVTTFGGTGVLKDGAGGNGTALAGFRFTDDNGTVNYGATLLSGNAIQITLSSSPVGTLRMDFGMANCPYGVIAPAASTIVYDSDTVPGETRGLPLQPCALQTVT